MTSLKIVPLAGKGEGVLEIHRSVKSALRGQAILHLETRLSEEELNRHVQSRILVWTLRAMELAVEPPEICFHRVSETSGLDMVESLRGVSHGAQ